MRLIIILSFFLLLIPSALATEPSVIDKVIQEEHVEEYPLVIRKNEAILKVITYKLTAKENNQQDEILKKIELIQNNNIVYEETFIPANEKLNIVYNQQDKVYFFGNTRYIFFGYALFNGDNTDYLAYAASTYPDSNPPHTYSVVRLMKKGSDYNSELLEGNIVLGTNYFRNPQTSPNIYDLVDNKYIIADMDDSLFTITVYHKIQQNSIRPANIEFAILPRALGEIKSTVTIGLYTKPDKNSASQSVIITPNTKTKFIGIKYPDTIKKGDNLFENENNMVHVIIDGQEGWVSELSDIYFLGLESRNVGVW